MRANPYNLPWISPLLESYHQISMLNIFGIANSSHNNSLFHFLPDFQNSLNYIKSLAEKPTELGDFQIQIFIVERGNIYYKLGFQIPFVERYIQENNIKAELISPVDPKIFSDSDNLEKTKMNHVQQDNLEITKPIITAYHPYIHTEIVIDGNHRINDAIVKGIRQIPAYRLNSYHLYKVLANDKLSQALYLYHHNLMTFYDSEYHLYRKFSEPNPEAPSPSKSFSIVV